MAVPSTTVPSTTVSRTTRRAALIGGVGATCAGLVVAAMIAAPSGNAATTLASCGTLFDDFSYASSSDPALSTNGWYARTGSGGPGMSGVSWSAGNVTFPSVSGGKVLQLTASTDGTGGGTTQAQLTTKQDKFLEGTYASRVRFTDAPASGSDGDHAVETFYGITPLAYDLDPAYSELDFEYLPNGGWGEPSSTMYETTWETYRNEPWLSVNESTPQRRSFDGWHDLVLQVSGGRARYYIDGAQVADHGGDNYPETMMSLNFNLWFIDNAGHTGGTSVYQQQVDWVFHAAGAVLTPADVATRVAALRGAGTAHTDTVGATGGCQTPSATSSPTGSPSAAPSPSASRSPSTPPSTPPSTSPSGTGSPTVPAGCAGVPAWDWGTVYLEGQRVVHTGKLWQARWWTQGSEPGLTAQWQLVGSC